MPPTITDQPSLLDRLYEQRSLLHEEWAKRVNDRAEFELAFTERMNSDDKPTDDEQAAHVEARSNYATDEDLDRREAELREFDVRIVEQTEIERRRDEAAEAAKPSANVQIVSEPRTYERYKAQGEHGVSFYRDFAVAELDGLAIQGTNRRDARKRLDRHAEEMRRELPKRQQAAEARARKQFQEAEGAQRASLFDPFHRGVVPNTIDFGPGMEQRVEPNLTPGQGGNFVFDLVAA